MEIRGFQGDDEDNATPKDGQAAIACNSPPRPVPLGPARRLSVPELPEYANDDMDTVDFTPPKHLPLLLPAKQCVLHQHVRAAHRFKEKDEELKTKLDEINAALAEKQQSSDKITDEPHELNLDSDDDQLGEAKFQQKLAMAAQDESKRDAPNLCWSRSLLRYRCQ